MTRLDTLRSQLARLQSEAARYQAERTRHHGAAVKASAASAAKQNQAARARSASSVQSYLRAAMTSEKKAVDEGKKVGDLTAKLAKNAKDQAALLKSIDAETKRASSRQAAADRLRRTGELSHARTLRGLMQQALIKRPAKSVRVLYVTANPEAVERIYQTADGRTVAEGEWLRIDREVREVGQAVKGALHRDLIDIKHLFAATFDDLTSGLNDHRPQVVHFSGHGGSGTLLFDEGNQTDAGDEVSFSRLAEVIDALDDPPILLVLNACNSIDGAEVLLRSVPAVVGMSGRVEDFSAKLFARKFYYAIASGQSLGSAMRQARIAMEQDAMGTGAELPAWCMREGVDVEQIVLVDPAAGGRAQMEPGST